jgi:asparagine synthase (glutamine-hydrolysing)
MCGFIGIIDFEKTTDLESNLKQSIDVIKHRGPDNQSILIDKENGVYLGFNRLKIIDLSDQSNQPFKSDDSQIILAFNGELYNYKILRKELRSEYQFKTESDTEVLLHCYQK